MEYIDSQTILNAIGNIGTIVAAIVSVFALVVALRANYRAELPQIMCYLDFDKDKSSVSLVVSNFGNGVARDITLANFDEEIVQDRFWKHLKKSFITKGIPILVPNAARSTTIAANPMTNLFDKSSPVTISYSVKGFMRRNKRISEEFVLDYSSFSGALYTISDQHKTLQTLQKIEKDLASIDKKINYQSQHDLP